jgi:hypothetical protein
MVPPPLDAVIQESNEVVDLYVVPRYPEDGRAYKFMVIEAQSPPKYHKILSSFPKTALHYCVTPQYPGSSAYNREKALAQLKNSVLAAFTAHAENPSGPSPHNPAPGGITTPTVGAANTAPAAVAGAEPVVSRPAAVGPPNPHSIAPANGKHASGSETGAVSSENTGDLTDFGGFFPVGTSFIAEDFNDMVFIAAEGGDAVAEAELTAVTPSNEPVAVRAASVPAPVAAPAPAVPMVLPPVPAPAAAATVVPVVAVPPAAPAAVLESPSVPMEVVQEDIAKTTEDVKAKQVETKAAPAAEPARALARAPVALVDAPGAVKAKAADAVPVDVTAPAARHASATSSDLPKEVAPVRNESSQQSTASTTTESPAVPPPASTKMDVVEEPPAVAASGAFAAPDASASSKPDASAAAESAGSASASAVTTAAAIENPSNAVALPPAAGAAPVSAAVSVPVSASSSKRPLQVQAQADRGLQTWKKRCLTKPEKYVFIFILLNTFFVLLC